MPIKFLLLGGGGGLQGFFRRGGGGSGNFIVMGVGIFPNIVNCLPGHPRSSLSLEMPMGAVL